MMIIRYSLDYENCNLEYDPDGDIVDYGDHCAVVFVLQSRLEKLNQKVTALQQENASLKQDALRLNWLDTQVKRHVVYSGYAWQEAGYESDRGLVCMIQGKRDRMSARQAIDTAMQASKQ